MAEELALWLESRVQDWVEALDQQGYSVTTVRVYRLALLEFAEWVEARPDLTEAGQIGREALASYSQHLMLRPLRSKGRRGRSLSARSRQRLLVSLRGFFRWAVRRGHLLTDPSSALELPRVPRTLPRTLLSVAEVKRLLQAVEVTDALGLRDRAGMEVLYSTGMRRAELAALRLEDVSLEERRLRVHGKGGRERVVPLGRPAASALRRYLEKGRPALLRRRSRSLFLNGRGETMDPRELLARVRDWARKAGIRKKIGLHTFRHSCATHMLRGGADIRYIQALLGHRSLTSTQVYTRVEVADLRRVLERCHPRERRRSNRGQKP